LNILLASLQERFGTEEVHEFGSCVIVPLKEFPKDHEETLKKQGYRVFYQSYRGQSCAFIRLGSHGSGSQKTDPQPEDTVPRPVAIPSREKESMEKDHEKISRGNPEQEKKSEGKTLFHIHWTREDRATLKQLYEQKVSVDEIAQKLKRTLISVQSQAQSLGLRRNAVNATAAPGELELVGEKALVEDNGAAPDRTEPLSEKPVVEHNEHLVREFLEATSVLYPRFRHAAALILKAAATEMQRGEA